MAHHSTILGQIVAFLPSHAVDALAKNRYRGQKFRSFNRWSQFMAMCIGQLSGRAGLRDLVMNRAAQSSKLYHLGIEPCSRASLAKVNEQQPAALYEAVFHKTPPAVPAIHAQAPLQIQRQAVSPRCHGYRSMPLRFPMGHIPYNQGRHQSACGARWRWVARGSSISRTADVMQSSGQKP